MSDLCTVAKELLQSGQVKVIVGYEKGSGPHRTRPVVIRSAEEAGRLVFDHYSLNNLAVYLTRKEIKHEGRIGIVAKGCDVRAIVQLIQEKQVKREDVVIIGMACDGMVREFGLAWEREHVAPKCAICDVRTPHLYDTLVGSPAPFEPPADSQLARIEQLKAMPPAERWAFWEREFEKCIRCYACRQICPLCFCDRCIADKNVPQWLESSASRRGNLAWNIMRAFHLAGRCVGCGECDRVCPVDIPLSLLNREMALVAKQEYGYEPGRDPEAPTLIGTYDKDDRQDFIQ